jgi:hypothetical protein
LFAGCLTPDAPVVLIDAFHFRQATFNAEAFRIGVRNMSQLDEPQVVSGNVGHNLHQEALQVCSRAAVDVDHLQSVSA